MGESLEMCEGGVCHVARHCCAEDRLHLNRRHLNDVTRASVGLLSHVSYTSLVQNPTNQVQRMSQTTTRVTLLRRAIRNDENNNMH